MTDSDVKVILESEYKFHGECSVFGEALKIAIKALEENHQYKEFGTVEELRLAKEKQIAKNPIEKDDTRFREHKCFYCPSCGESLETNEDDTFYNGWLNYCDNCGQAIDWSDAD